MFAHSYRITLSLFMTIIHFTSDKETNTLLIFSIFNIGKLWVKEVRSLLRTSSALIPFILIFIYLFKRPSYIIWQIIKWRTPPVPPLQVPFMIKQMVSYATAAVADCFTISNGDSGVTQESCFGKENQNSRRAEILTWSAAARTPDRCRQRKGQCSMMMSSCIYLTTW